MIIDFTGVIDLVDSVGGVNLNFPYPVRDNDNGNNNSGLSITQAGCQTLNGDMALALARSRFYEYEVRPGYWEYDGSGDLGRIQRQNVIIKAVINKAQSQLQPADVERLPRIDRPRRHHGRRPSRGATWCRWPSGTTPSPGPASRPSRSRPSGRAPRSAGDVEVVQEPAAEQMISQFLGAAPSRQS